MKNENIKKSNSNEQQKAAMAKIEQGETNYKFLCNSSAKSEMFSLKQALAAVKNAYQAKAEGTREYITDKLGIKPQQINNMQWQELQEFAKCGKSGRYSTWAVLNALPKWKEQADEKKALEEAKKRIESKKGAKVA